MPFATDRIHDTDRQLAESLRLDSEERMPSDNGTGHSQLAASRFAFSPQDVREELNRTIFGQPKTVELIEDVMKVASVGLSDPRKPISSLLFAGPTGVGKTETVRSVARAIHGTADALCRIDMNTLSQEHYAAAFSGSPPGYVGSKEGMTLLDQHKIEGSRDLPGIVLFDEIEKASREVVLAMMNILDNGILTVASGERTISFRNSIIFMTSNIGAKENSNALDWLKSNFQRLVSPARRKDQMGENGVLISELLRVYPPEFVNRIDHIQQLEPLGKEIMTALVDHQMDLLNHRLQGSNIHVSVTQDVATHISDLGYDPTFGARELRRIFRTELEIPLARFLSSNNAPESDHDTLRKVVADLKDSAVTFTVNPD